MSFWIFFLKGIDDRRALRTGGIERDFKGVADRIGGNGTQKLHELIGVDEGKAACEKVDAPAAALPGRRCKSRNLRVDNFVARIETPARQNASTLRFVDARF